MQEPREIADPVWLAKWQLEREAAMQKPVAMTYEETLAQLVRNKKLREQRDRDYGRVV